MLPVSFFTGKHDNRPKVRHLPWDALAKRLSAFQARAEKDGPLWSPAAYDVHKDARRAKGQVRTVSCAVFDFDHAEPPREHLERLRVVHLVHSTHSHLTVCPDNPTGDPRYRVVVPFRRPVVVDGDRDGRWYALWLRLRHHLAPGAVLDESCKDASRMYYDPACRPGAEHYVDLLDGEGTEFLDPATVPELPPDVAAALRAQRASPLGDAEGRLEAGARHGALLSLAGTMRDRGAGGAAILAALQAMNATQCVPPKSTEEVERIARYVAEKPPGGRFVSVVGPAGEVLWEHEPPFDVVSDLPPDAEQPAETIPPDPPEPPPDQTSRSRSPSNREVGNGKWEETDEGAMASWQHAEPKPRGWAWDGMVPQGGVVTLLYGDSGIAKSWLGLALLLSRAAGVPFLDRAMAPAGPVLWLDVELDHEEFLRRAYAVARGMGLTQIPEGVHYYKVPAALSDHRVLDRIQGHITRLGVVFYCLDSLTVALMGGDAKEAFEVIPALKGMERWGIPGVAIDHIRSNPVGVSQAGLNPFGTVFKKHVARSMLQMVRATGGGITLTVRKSTFGPEGDTLYADALLVPDPHVPGRLLTVSVVTVAPTSEAVAGAEEHLPQGERVYLVVANAHGAGTTPELIAADLECKAKTASNHLSALKRAGRVVNILTRWYLPQWVTGRKEDQTPPVAQNGRIFPVPVPDPPIGNREVGNGKSGTGGVSTLVSAPDTPAPSPGAPAAAQNGAPFAVGDAVRVRRDGPAGRVYVVAAVNPSYDTPGAWGCQLAAGGVVLAVYLDAELERAAGAQARTADSV